MPGPVELDNGVSQNPLTDVRLDGHRTPFDGKKPSGTAPKKRAHVKGDMHGSAVNFLHALMANGVVKFTGAPTAAELTPFGIPPLALPAPGDYYELFKVMYSRPLNQWQKGQLDTFLTFFASKMEISEYNQFIDMGDDFFDRGQNDALTMMLFMKVAEKRNAKGENAGAMTAIMSNHASALVWIMDRYAKNLKQALEGKSPTPAELEKIKNKAFLDAFPKMGKNKQFQDRFELDVRGKQINVGFPTDVEGFPIADFQCPSGLALYELVKNDAITPDYINNFYNTAFIPNMKLIHYVISTDSRGIENLELFAHAPINEVDVLRAAICCLEDEEPALSAADRARQN
jgi:hypothetical protein